MPSPGGVGTLRVSIGAAVEGGADEGGSARGAVAAASKTGSEARAAGIVPWSASSVSMSRRSSASMRRCTSEVARLGSPGRMPS
eukprot:4219536-Pleurochrysis_carterae.AAC.1